MIQSTHALALVLVAAATPLGGCATSTTASSSRMMISDATERAERIALEILSDPKARASLQQRAETAIQDQPANAEEVWETYYLNRQRGEFEKRGDYETRLSALDPEALFFFELEPKSSFRVSYDIDTETMQVTLPFSDRSVFLKELSGFSITVLRDTVSKAKVGSNAYGAEVQFSETSGTEYLVTIGDLGIFAGVTGLTIHEPRRGDLELIHSFKVQPDKARELKGSLRVQAGISLEGCNLVEEYTLASAATRNLPYAAFIQQKYMAARLRSLVVYDGTTVWGSFVTR